MEQIFLSRDNLNYLLEQVDNKPLVDESDLLNSDYELLYLSVRNVKTLLSKLDRLDNGESIQCTILKYDTTQIRYPSSTQFSVTSIQSPMHNNLNVCIYCISDAEYYGERLAGQVHPLDLPKAECY